MKKIKTIILITFLNSLLFAHECNSYDTDKAMVLAEKSTQQLIYRRWYPDIVPVSVNIDKCDYNSYDHHFRISYTASWNGAIIKSNYYEMHASLNINSDGTNPKILIDSANEQLSSYRSMMAIIQTVLALDNIQLDGKN